MLSGQVLGNMKFTAKSKLKNLTIIYVLGWCIKINWIFLPNTTGIEGAMCIDYILCVNILTIHKQDTKPFVLDLGKTFKK